VTDADAIGSPVIVTGMHRSGTSFTAALLASAGIAMGTDLLPADRHNRHGYFEDNAFLSLNREMVQAAARGGTAGHPDWGWTEDEVFDPIAAGSFRERARELLEARREAFGARRVWGWKDPRTTLLLDFWDRLAPHARYVLVYRQPWDVADSMQRLGADVFLRRPEYAWRIWRSYNERLLAFHRAHRERSVLVCGDAVRREPGRFFEVVRSRLGLSLEMDSPSEAVVDRTLFRSTPSEDPLIRLAAETHRDCADVLERLDAAADISGSALWSEHGSLRGVWGGDGARVAVVIPCFNHGEFVVDAVASAERSVTEPFEIVIVNDGSTEERTVEVLAELRRLGYRVADQPNAGLGAARNHGFRLARAPYVIPLDADNRLRDGFVGEAVGVMERDDDVGIVYGDRHEFGARERTVTVPAFEPDELLPFNFLDACAVVRKRVWEQCGGYDETLPNWEDWDLWIGAVERGWKFHRIPGPAYDYRVRPGSMSAMLQDEDVRRLLLSFVIAKHRDLYWKRLPEILNAALRSEVNYQLLKREHDELRARLG
jgi:glycosyltransferase involved in cell wall biosynthesis